MYFFQIDNGTSLIEVKDNGYGISKDDALYMGLPSYTSKISNFEDLGNILLKNLLIIKNIYILGYNINY